MGKDAGFTLFDLLFALSLAAVLLTVGIPSLSAFIDRHAADNAERRLVRAYQAARHHAVTHSQKVSICGSDDGVNCSKEWQKLLITFSDSNNNAEPDAAEIIAVARLNLRNARVTTRMSLGKKVIEITPRGAVTFNGSLIYCPNSGRSHLFRRVTWNRVGRVYRGADQDNDGRVDDTDGDPLTCP